MNKKNGANTLSGQTRPKVSEKKLHSGKNRGAGTADSTRQGLSKKDSERLDRLSHSLQKVYQTAVDEAVPDSMLDLLKKLG